MLVGHGWGQSRAAADEGSETAFGSVGPKPFLDAGFTVLSWDARGFGQSGGTVSVDGPDTEGRDVQALLDHVAKQPEAALDAPGDPRAGMSGSSYGGGIQLVTAGIDSRVDAIVPNIAWNSLIPSLNKDGAVKSGWSSVLVAAATERNLDPHIRSAYNSGLTSGTISEEDRRWFGSRGPGDLVDRIKIPTLLTQGTRTRCSRCARR